MEPIFVSPPVHSLRSWQNKNYSICCQNNLFYKEYCWVIPAHVIHKHYENTFKKCSCIILSWSPLFDPPCTPFSRGRARCSVKLLALPQAHSDWFHSQLPAVNTDMTPPPYQDNVRFLWEQSKFKERYTQRSICSYSCQSPKATCSSLFSLSLLLNFTQGCTHRVECTCKDNFKLLFFFTVIIFKF